MLNPSCNSVTDGFPAIGDPPFDADGRDVALAELEAAGFPRGSSKVTYWEVKRVKPDSEAGRMARVGILVPSAIAKADTEWVTVHDIEAHYQAWIFRRCWYYWAVAAKWPSRSVPEKIAGDFNHTWGHVVRVNGYAGGTEVKGPVDRYHIDTPKGLQEFVKLLESLKV